MYYQSKVETLSDLMVFICFLIIVIYLRLPGCKHVYFTSYIHNLTYLLFTITDIINFNIPALAEHIYKNNTTLTA